MPDFFKQTMLIRSPHTSRYIAFLLLLATAQAGCTSNSVREDAGNEATIEGTIAHLPGEAHIVLSKIEVKGPVAIDSTTAGADGKFTLTVPADDERLYLLAVGEQRLPVFLEKGKHQLTGDFNQLYTSAVYTNSPLTNLMRRVEGMRQTFDMEAKTLQYQYEAAMVDRNKPRADSVLARYDALQQGSKQRLKALIDSMGPSPVSHLATSMLSSDEDYGFLDSLAMRFEKEKPNAVYTQKMNAFMEAPRKFAVGKEAPVFTQNDPNGKPVSLERFRGKWLLIDFWASWCKPCRAENPNVVRAYKEFKAKGFEVLGVSCDAEREAWMKAIVTDHLFWAHVSDLKGFDNEAARLYAVNSIPASFLLDPQGRIVAKNLRGAALEKKLRQVMP